MAKRLLILGAGGFGREVYSWSLDIIQNDWYVGGFLDDTGVDLSSYQLPVNVVGTIVDYQPQAGDLLVCAIGDPASRLKIVRALKTKGAQFANIIHPTAVVSRHAMLGEGLIVAPHAFISSQTKIGNFAIINVAVCIGHDAELGEGCTLSPYAGVMGYAKLGEGVMMGCHASIIPKLTVGEYAVIGAGSAVIREVPARTTVVGVPAKKIC